MIPYIKNLSLTWIKNNKDLALHILSLGCIMFLVNYAFKQHEKYEGHLIEDIKIKEEDLKTSNKNFDNSQLLLKLMDRK